MRSVSLPAFAKINLDLRVLGTRPDGFHDLKTVFQSLALFDNVTVTSRRGPLAVTCDEPDIPADRRNLVWKAATLLHHVRLERPRRHATLRSICGSAFHPRPGWAAVARTRR